jgi:hypothetical protein
MREEVRRELELFRLGPTLLKAALRQFPKKMWCYQQRDDRLSVHDLVIQLAEAEATMYVRCRQFIAEPASATVEFGYRAGARSFVYFHQDVRDSLKIIAQLRKATYRLLCALPDHLFDTVVIDARFGSIPLNRWIMIQQRHLPACIEQMRKNYNSWIKAHPPRKPATKQGFAPDDSQESLGMK